MHDTPFRAMNILDESRIVDAESLRYLYCDETGQLQHMAANSTINGPQISVFEVLIALCLRYERDVLYDGHTPAASLIFNASLANSGLAKYRHGHYDEREVDDILNRIIERRYGPTGEGNFFYIRKPRRPLNTVDIWTQLCWYIGDMYPLNEYDDDF